MFVLYLLLSCLLLLLSVCGTVCVCGAARVFIRAPCHRPCSGGEGGVVLGEDEDGGHRVPHVVSLLAHCCRGRVDVVRDSVLRLHLHTHTLTYPAKHPTVYLIALVICRIKTCFRPTTCLRISVAFGILVHIVFKSYDYFSLFSLEFTPMFGEAVEVLFYRTISSVCLFLFDLFPHFLNHLI